MPQKVTQFTTIRINEEKHRKRRRYKEKPTALKPKQKSILAKIYTNDEIQAIPDNESEKIEVLNYQAKKSRRKNIIKELKSGR